MTGLRVAIDARVPGGYSGGVESVLTGLVAGLAGLPDEEAEYAALVLRDHDAWLRPHARGRVKLLAVDPPGWAARIGLSAGLRRLAPVAADIWRRRPLLPGRRVSGPPKSDGTVERWGADVVHLVRQAGFLTDIPTIYHPHDFQHRHLPQFFSARELQQRDLWFSTLGRRASLVAVASSWAREDAIAQLGLPPERVAVVPWAPPTDVFERPTDAEVVEARERLRLPARFIYYGAQTWPHKNHLGLIEAIAQLRGAGLDIPVVFSGRMTAHAYTIRRQIAQLGLTDRVQWLGFLPGRDVRCVYALARAVVIPSRFEAASGPLWEAFAAGVPAACSSVTSLPRQAGDAALLFDPDDTSSMAKAVAELWTNEHTRETLIGRGRTNVSRFTWDRTARHFRAHYRRIAGKLLTEEDRALLTASSLI